MKVNLLVEENNGAVRVRISPDTDFDAFALRQLDCATPSFHLDEKTGYLEAVLRPCKE